MKQSVGAPMLVASVLMLLVLMVLSSATVVRGDYVNTRTGAVGALYQISNAVDNSILVSKIMADGSIAYSGTVATGATGLANAATAGGDPLFSSSAIRVASANGLLFAVNAGGNSLTMFSINKASATELTRVTTVSVTGDFPVSVGVWEAASGTSQRNLVCVITGGASNKLECFQFTATTLTAVPSFTRSLGLTQTTPPAGPPNTASQVRFTPDGNAIVVLIKRADRYVSVYPIDWSAFTLAANPVISVAPTNSGGVAFEAATVRGNANNGLFLVDATPGVTAFTVNSATGATTATSNTFVNLTTSTAAALCWVTYSPNLNLYLGVASAVPGLTTFSVDSNTLAITSGRSFNFDPTSAGNTNLLDVVVANVGGQEFLYGFDSRAINTTAFRLTSADSITKSSSINWPTAGVASQTRVAQGIAVYLNTQSSGAAATAVYSLFASIFVAIAAIFSSNLF